MKKKISLTISDDIIKEIDKTIDGYLILNRSHAVEVLLKRALGARKISQALILAGGKGTRMRPFTYEIPKSLLPVHGKPILEHMINRLKDADVKEILISVGFKAEKIISYFGDGSKFGVKIDYIIEDKPLGTAGPLLLAKNKLEKGFLMLNGDIVSDFDFGDMISFYMKSNGSSAMVLTEVKDPYRFGVAELKGNKIVRFVEKPEKGKAPSNLINAGVYILTREIFSYLKNGKQMIENIFPILATDGKLNAYVHSGYWVDIGTIQSYEKVQKDLHSGKLKWLQ